MKVAVFIVCLILSLGSSWSQVKLIVNLGYGALLKEYRFQEFQLGGGVQLNDHFSLQLNYRYMYYEFDMTTTDLEPMKSDILSLSTNYRILNKKSIISPIIILDIGAPFYSNANKELIYNTFLISQNYSLGSWRYNRGLFSGKLKAMCDIRLKSFDILLGGSYNLYVYNKSNLKPDYWNETTEDYIVTKTITVPMYNFGIEASLMYTIPSKKEK